MMVFRTVVAFSPNKEAIVRKTLLVLVFGDITKIVVETVGDRWIEDFTIVAVTGALFG